MKDSRQMVVTKVLDGAGIGSRVRRLREARGWSTADLAAASGMSKGYVGLLETGKVPNPKTFDLASVADALDVSLWNLLGEDVAALEEVINDFTSDPGIRIALVEVSTDLTVLPRERQLALLRLIQAMVREERRADAERRQDG